MWAEAQKFKRSDIIRKLGERGIRRNTTVSRMYGKNRNGRDQIQAAIWGLLQKIKVMSLSQDLQFENQVYLGSLYSVNI